MFPLVLLCVILSGPLSAGLQVCLLVWVTCLRKGESSRHYSHLCILQTSNERTTTTVWHISQVEPDIFDHLRKTVRLSNDTRHVMFDSTGESSSNKLISSKHPSSPSTNLPSHTSFWFQFVSSLLICFPAGFWRSLSVSMFCRVK